MKNKAIKNLTSVLLLALLPVIAVSVAFGQGTNTSFVNNEVIVKLNNTADLAAISQAYGLSSVPLAQIGDRPVYRLRVPSGVSVQNVVALLQSDPLQRVVMAEPNYIVRTPASAAGWENGLSWSIGTSWSLGSSLKGYSLQWMRNRIDLDAAHAVTRGQGIKVAVLDSGIDRQHPLFAGKLLPGYDFVSNDSDPSEVGVQGIGAFGHGTHVSGIVAMVAPDAKIIPIRVLDENGFCDTWRLARALIYAANPDGDINTRDGADVINLSIGTTDRTNLIRKLIAAETNDGTLPDDDDLPQVGHPAIVVVASAGNTGNGTHVYPAAEHDVPGLIAVGASTPADTIADFSTRGEWIELMAPGDKIVSSVPGGRYGVWRGTSMAAPVVSGIAALVRSRYQSLKPSGIFEHIRRTSVSCNGAINRRADAGRAVTINP